MQYPNLTRRFKFIVWNVDDMQKYKIDYKGQNLIDRKRKLEH